MGLGGGGGGEEEVFKDMSVWLLFVQNFDHCLHV